MTIEEAKAENFTHTARMYGVNGFYKEDGHTFEPESKLEGYLLDFLIWIDCVLEFNKSGFPIEIKGEI